MYKVSLYKKDRLLPHFNNKGFETMKEVHEKLGYWYDVKRSDQAAQFIIIEVDTDTIVGILTRQSLQYEKTS